MTRSGAQLVDGHSGTMGSEPGFVLVVPCACDPPSTSIVRLAAQVVEKEVADEVRHTLFVATCTLLWQSVVPLWQSVR